LSSSLFLLGIFYYAIYRLRGDFKSPRDICLFLACAVKFQNFSFSFLISALWLLTQRLYKSALLHRCHGSCHLGCEIYQAVASSLINSQRSLMSHLHQPRATCSSRLSNYDEKVYHLFLHP
jgi:hypothetical protein